VPVVSGPRRDDSDKNEKAPKHEGMASRLLKIRTVIVNGQIDESVAEKVMAQLLILDSESHDPIRVIITSQGGHVDSGYAIYDVLRYVESPVITIAAGWVASIAVPIFLGADEKHRYSLPNTRFLLHQPSGGAGGQASDIRIAAEEILKLKDRLNRLIAQETGRAPELVAEDCDRNFWMSAEEALEYGLVGKIIRSVAEIGAPPSAADNGQAQPTARQARLLPSRA
jgi:ATP-dependent Clp protease protease subunit